MCAAINPLDVKIYRGYVTRMGWRMALPFTPGYDFSGTIDAINPLSTLPPQDGTASESGSAFAIDDEVFGVHFGSGRHDDAGDPSAPLAGAFAEYMLIPISKLSRKPPHVSHEVAAGLSLAGTTALQCLYQCAGLPRAAPSTSTKPKVLVLGASSVVGAIVVQLAKLSGMWVAATCSARNFEYVQQFGADRVIEYTSSTALKRDEDPTLRGMDAVIDCVGEPSAFARMQTGHVLKPSGGAFVSVVSFDAGMDPKAHPPLAWCAKYGFSHNKSHQDELIALVAAGSLRIPVDETFPFTTEGVRGLFAKVETGKSRGKNILKIIDRAEG